MPTVLGEPYKPTWMGYPPHMSKEDYLLWNIYKITALKDALNVYFDVGLGGQEEVPEGTTPQMAHMWLRNTQSRADVVIETETEWRIIELRHQSTGSELGRILKYRALWQREPPDKKPVRVILVVGRKDDIIKELAESAGVEYVFIPF